MVELLEEVAHEIVSEPVTFVIELVQFGILLFIIKAVAFGVGKRKGMVTNMLAERRERVTAQLAEADAGLASREAAARRVAEIASAADTEAAAALRDARKQARQQKAAIIAEADAQAAQIVQDARDALSKEETDMLQGIRDRLVDVVTASTQQVLEHGLSPAEQREVIQNAIVSGIDDLEGVTLA
jgi:F-type H+-transporting ATPase subunit b